MHSCSQVSLSHDSPLPVNWIRPLVRDSKEAPHETAVKVPAGGQPCVPRDWPGRELPSRPGVSSNPAGTAEDLIAAVGHQFHRDYGVVLRAVLFAVDRHRARQITGVAAEGSR